MKLSRNVIFESIVCYILQIESFEQEIRLPTTQNKAKKIHTVWIEISSLEEAWNKMFRTTCLMAKPCIQIRPNKKFTRKI